MKCYPILFLAALLIVSISCEVDNINEPGLLVPKTTIEDPNLPSLTINGIPLHLETFGDWNNPMLIFLHGGPGSDYRAFISENGIENASRYPEARTFPRLGLAQLADQYFCIFYDRRGSGLSPRFDRAALSLQDQIDDLDVLIQYFLELQAAQTGQAPGRVNLFGLSFGGYLATAYNNQHPNRVDKTVLYEPRPFTEEAFDLLELTIPFARIDEDWVDMITTAGTHLTPDSHERADFLRAIPASNNAVEEFKEAKNTPYWRLGAFAALEIEQEIRKEDWVITDQLNNYQGDLLFLYGANTEAAPDLEAYLDLMISYYPQGERLEIPDAAHNGHWDNPHAIADAIRQFIQ
ncbi:MAG: alpha/beta hydrolase [Bacteroidota bacterium]